MFHSSVRRRKRGPGLWRERLPLPFQAQENATELTLESQTLQERDALHFWLRKWNEANGIFKRRKVQTFGDYSVIQSWSAIHRELTCELSSFSTPPPHPHPLHGLFRWWEFGFQKKKATLLVFFSCQSPCQTMWSLAQFLFTTDSGKKAGAIIKGLSDHWESIQNCQKILTRDMFPYGFLF